MSADNQLPEREPPQKRAIFVVGGEQELLRVYEMLHPDETSHLTRSQPGKLKTADLFEEVWNLR
jgi:hypothetical protein